MTTSHAICLGCGCVCSDLLVTHAEGRISGVENACPLGRAWLRGGDFPQRIVLDGADASLDEAFRGIAELLFHNPHRTLIYVADDVGGPALGRAAALADTCRASIDAPTSDTVAGGLLAAQRRGRASATLGELRHRADTVVFWGVDPHERSPRFMERFVSGTPQLAGSRSLVAIDVGNARGPQECRERISLPPDREVDALSVARGVLQNRVTAMAVRDFREIVDLTRRLISNARYVAIVFDAEPGPVRRDVDLAEALVAFSQALNSQTRAALFALRAGGNRNGFESLLTWQTGYPFAVDFADGFPVYVADESASERLARGRYDAAVVLGSTERIPRAVLGELERLPTAVIGTCASEASFAPRVAIDTGAAGIHDQGLVLRMDDVPFDASPFLSHPRSLDGVLSELARSLATAAVVPS